MTPALIAGANLGRFARADRAAKDFSFGYGHRCAFAWSVETLPPCRCKRPASGVGAWLTLDSLQTIDTGAQRKEAMCRSPWYSRRSKVPGLNRQRSFQTDEQAHVHKGTAYPGEHEAIISRDLRNRVHGILRESPRVRARRSRTTDPALLKEPIFGSWKMIRMVVFCSARRRALRCREFGCK